MALLYHDHNPVNKEYNKIMALFIRQDENRSKLQQKLVAELQEKAKQQSQLGDDPDGVEDTEYVKGTKQTSNFAWIWIIAAAVLLGASVWLTLYI